MALLVLTWLVVGGCTLVGGVMVMFIDNCPPSSCSSTGAMGAVGGGIGAACAVAVGASALVWTWWHRPRRSWPWTLGALLACAGLCALGLFGGASELGH